MQTVLGLLSAIVVVMVFGIEEPRVEGQCRMARARQVREVAARPAAIDAKVSDGKVIVSFAESERCTVRRVVVRELTTERYAWDFEMSRDGGQTWERLHHAAYPSPAEHAA